MLVNILFVPDEDMEEGQSISINFYKKENLLDFNTIEDQEVRIHIYYSLELIKINSMFDYYDVDYYTLVVVHIQKIIHVEDVYKDRMFDLVLVVVYDCKVDVGKVFII